MKIAIQNPYPCPPPCTGEGAIHALDPLFSEQRNRFNAKPQRNVVKAALVTRVLAAIMARNRFLPRNLGYFGGLFG